MKSPVEYMSASDGESEHSSKENVEESSHEFNVDLKVQNEDESRPRFHIKMHKVHTSEENDKSTY